VYIALALTPPLTALVIAAGAGLGALGLDPTVARLAAPYVRATAWSLGPLLIYAAFRRYLQAIGRLSPIVFALISANVLNALANWVLVFGHLGAPAWGVEGSGWATTVSRAYMALVLVAATFYPGRSWPVRAWRPDPARLKELLVLGLPAAVQVTLEVGVFATATALAGRLEPASLAAHQIVLNVASVTFMIPLGLSSAAAVRVGRALGARDPGGAARAGWTAIALGAGFMAMAGLTFLLVPGPILGSFTTDPAVVRTGLALLGVAAFFQVFDGLQGVATGALRGAGDTRTPMLVNLLAHWALGLPCAYALAFPGRLGVLGLWLGLSLGLVVAGLVLIRAWSLEARRLRAADEGPREIEGGPRTDSKHDG
jgi:MATE family multidrug resistance protein